ncbi:MAG: ATP-dependent RNA helicase DeaD, partial [Flavobacteriales bacterium]
MTDITFASLGLSEELLGAIAAEGFTAPTDIQREGVPALRSGRDVILQAQTGTGKTAAFVFPIVDDMTPNPGVIEVLVLVPTRELAQQVSNEFEKFGGPRGISSTAIYGGASFEKQYVALETCQVVVATPGRLLDLHRRKKIKLNSVRHFGLDESDEMLSMGFEKDVMDVVAFLPEGRQSFLCSATYNEDIKRVARAFIKDPIIVDVSSDQIGAQSVKHEYVAVSLADKLTAVRRLIDTWASDGAIVFCNTRAATFRVYETLLQEDVSVDVLNGELSQSEREKALGRMRADEIRFLVATDVAARGIDISGLPAVVNFDMPESPDVYIHRTGRTGRAGQAGVAYSLVTPADISVFHALHKFYKLELNEVSLPNPNEVMDLKADRVLDAVLDNLDHAKDLPYAIHIPIAARLATRPGGQKVIAKLIAFYDQASAGSATTISELKAFARPSTTAEADTPEDNTAEPEQSADADAAVEKPSRRRAAPKVDRVEEPAP